MSNAAALAVLDNIAQGQQVRVTDCWGDTYTGAYSGLNGLHLKVTGFGYAYRIPRDTVTLVESIPEPEILTVEKATTELEGRVIVDRVTDARFRVRAVENESTGTFLDIALIGVNDHYDVGDTREIWVDGETMPRWAIEAV